MFEQFPYADMQQLNLDWMIKIAKDFLDQYTQIQQVISDGLDELDAKATELQGLLDEWYNTHSQDIQNQLAAALADLNAWYTQHQDYLDATLEQNIAAFNSAADLKAAETLETIPDDYTALSNHVISNTTAIKNAGTLANLLRASTNKFDATNCLNGYWNQNGFNAANSWKSSHIMIPLFNKNTIYVNANYSGYCAFYDDAGSFISSQAWTQDTSAGARASVAVPAGAYFVRACITANTISDAANFFVFFNSSDVADDPAYISYLRMIDYVYKPDKEFFVVNKNPAYGDFITIQDAVNAAHDGAVILVMNGIYNEQIDARGKTIHLVGMSKDFTQVISSDDRRDYPPLEITSGSVTNMGFIAIRGTQPYPSYPTPYAVHIDYDESADKVLTFSHCYFRSDWNSAVGIGMRRGFSLAFYDCEFTNSTTSMGPVYFHDCSNESLAGHYQLRFARCQFSGGGNYALTITPIGYEANDMLLILEGNNLYSNGNGATNNAVNKQDPVSPYPISVGDKFMNTATITLSPISYGNRIPMLNY